MDPISAVKITAEPISSQSNHSSQTKVGGLGGVEGSGSAGGREDHRGNLWCPGWCECPEGEKGARRPRVEKGFFLKKGRKESMHGFQISQLST